MLHLLDKGQIGGTVYGRYVSLVYTLFMEKQNNIVTANKRLYPFTEVNPFMSWSDKLSMVLYGDSPEAKILR